MLFNLHLFNDPNTQKSAVPEPQDTWTDEEVDFVKECLKAQESAEVIGNKLRERFNTNHSVDAINLKISDIEREMLEKSYQSTDDVSSVENETEAAEVVMEPTQIHMDLGIEDQPKLTYNLYDLSMYIYSQELKDDDSAYTRVKARIRNNIKSYKDVEKSNMFDSSVGVYCTYYTFPNIETLEKFATYIRTNFPETGARETLAGSLRENAELFKGDKLYFSANDILGFVFQPKNGNEAMFSQYRKQYLYISHTLSRSLCTEDNMDYNRTKYYRLNPQLVFEFIKKLKSKYANIGNFKNMQIEDIIAYAESLSVNQQDKDMVNDLFTKVDLANIAYNLDKKVVCKLPNTFIAYLNKYFKKTGINGVKINNSGLKAYKLNPLELENVLTFIRETFNSDLKLRNPRTTVNKETEVLVEPVMPVESESNNDIPYSLADARTSVKATQEYRNISPVNMLLYNQAKAALANMQTILTTEDKLVGVNVDIQKNSASVTFTWN